MNTSDEMYVLKQPKHTLTSIVVMNSDYPISELSNTSLYRLSQVSDLIFVFSPLHFHEESKINKVKFTTLHQGCAFIISGGELWKTIFKVLQYCQEIFNKHVGYTISNCSDLKYIDNNTVDNLVKVNMSSITKPIFSSERLTEHEMYEFYKVPEYKKSSVLSRFFGGTADIDNSFASYILWGEFLPEENDCRYCTWKSESNIMYFKNGIMKIFLDQYNEIKDILSTFTDPDIRYLFANLTVILGIDTINSNIEDLDINKIS